ncbi:MAG: ABC transporter ATP-binding protein [Candidatus Neomarinimicrobiota bacterium]
MEASITLKKVGKLSGDITIFAGLTFGVERGSMVAIVGGNEAGKSTLLKILAGVENPEFGSIFINGLDIVKRRIEIRSQVGYVPNKIDLDPWLTLEQNIRFTGYLFGLNDETISNRLVSYARDLGLVEFLHSPAHSVSSGTLKKTMVLRALIHNPKILLLDDPTAFMDADSNSQTWNLLKSMKGAKTIIYCSQNLIEVENAHDRILVMQEGKIVLDGKLSRLLESFHEYTQFQVEFETLSSKLYKKIILNPKVKNPSKSGKSIHFYGKERKVLFEVINTAAEAILVDFGLKKLGLQDLLEAKFSSAGL